MTLEVSFADPASFGMLFATVTRQALEVEDFNIAGEMIQGLGTLRAAATQLSAAGEVYRALRSSGCSRGLETGEGILAPALV